MTAFMVVRLAFPQVTAVEVAGIEAARRDVEPLGQGADLRKRAETCCAAGRRDVAREQLVDGVNELRLTTFEARSGGAGEVGARGIGTYGRAGRRRVDRAFSTRLPWLDDHHHTRGTPSGVRAARSRRERRGATSVSAAR